MSCADAERRDLTMNALYLDLDCMKVVDPLNCGLRDLEGRILRCPKSAKETLSEDPVRVLRVARFLSVWEDMEMCEDLDVNMRDESIVDKLIEKKMELRFRAELIRITNLDFDPQFGSPRWFRVLERTPKVLEKAVDLLTTTAPKDYARKLKIQLLLPQQQDRWGDGIDAETLLDVLS